MVQNAMTSLSDLIASSFFVLSASTDVADDWLFLKNDLKEKKSNHPTCYLNDELIASRGSSVKDQRQINWSANLCFARVITIYSGLAQATIQDTYTMHSLSSSRQETQVVVMAMHFALPALHLMAPLSGGLFFPLPTRASQPIVSRACILHPEEAARFLHHLTYERGQDWCK